MNEDMNAKIKLLLRSEKALMKMEMRKKSRQAVYVAIGLIAVLAMLVMFNATVYLYLESSYTQLASAMILTGMNLIAAVIFFVIASRQEVGPEAESMQEIRDFAWEQLSGDIEEVKQDISEFRDGIHRVGKGVNSVMNRDFFGLKGMLPIITALLETHNKKK
ncbi:MAG: phage holin family protein [Campylobacterota bacterium]|nr:phage holin family protein [Campylobacterota bacterium]